MVQPEHARVRRYSWEHEAGVAVGGRQFQVGNGVIQIVKEHLGQAATPLRVGGTEVGKPPVVGADPLEASLVFGPVGGRVGDERSGREERWHGVGEDDLSGHTLGVQIAIAPFVIPVA